MSSPDILIAIVFSLSLEPFRKIGLGTGDFHINLNLG